MNVLKGELERPRKVLDKNILKINRAKTKFLEFRFKTELYGNDLRIEYQLINKVERFECLDSVVLENERF